MYDMLINIAMQCSEWEALIFINTLLLFSIKIFNIDKDMDYWLINTSFIIWAVLYSTFKLLRLCSGVMIVIPMCILELAVFLCILEEDKFYKQVTYLNALNLSIAIAYMIN